MPKGGIVAILTTTGLTETMVVFFSQISDFFYFRETGQKDSFVKIILSY